MELMGIRNGAFYIGQNQYITSKIVEVDTSFNEILNAGPELLEQVFNIREPVSRIRQAEFAFNSGWRVSVVWGTAAMCENQNRGLMNDLEFKEEVETVEVSIYHKDYDIHMDPSTREVRQGQYIEGYVDSARLKTLLLFTVALDRPDPPAEAVIDEYDEYSEDLPDEDF